MTDILIIGSGLAGLSCAYHLKKQDIPVRVLERNSRVGGLCRTESEDGFSFDHSIHILYPMDPYAGKLIKDVLLQGNFSIQKRESYCYSNGVYTRYPYQAHNYGLPNEIIYENLVGLIEATYHNHKKDPENFEDWIVHTFGDGIAKNFMIPYNRKVWAWDLRQMNFNWISERVPRPTVKEVLAGALREPMKDFGPNHVFWYPEKGGIESLPKGFEPHINGEINLNTTVVAIDPVKKKVTTVNGDGRAQSMDYKILVTTLPLPALLKLMDPIPEGDWPTIDDLKYNVVHTVNIGLRGPDLPPYHWVYYPTEETIFHRLSFPHLFSDWMVPEGCQSIMCEISESPYRPRDREKLLEACIADLKKVGMLGPDHEILHKSVMTLDPAYIIYDLEHRDTVDRLHRACHSVGIYPCGRFGDWEYLNMDHSIMSGKRIADAIASRARPEQLKTTT